MFFAFLFRSFHLSSCALFIPPSPSLHVTQTLGHLVTEQALLPPPHYGTRPPFYREKNPHPAFSSVLDSQRIICDAKHFGTLNLATCTLQNA